MSPVETASFLKIIFGISFMNQKRFCYLQRTVAIVQLLKNKERGWLSRTMRPTASLLILSRSRSANSRSCSHHWLAVFECLRLCGPQSVWIKSICWLWGTICFAIINLHLDLAESWWSTLALIIKCRRSNYCGGLHQEPKCVVYFAILSNKT